jgi:acyl carrier protein
MRKTATTELEQKLVIIWKEVLGREEIGVDENFFEIGGHSLMVIQVMSRIFKTLNIKIDLRDVFNHPTIAELAEIVKQKTTSAFQSIPKAKEHELYDLSDSQKRLWIVDQLEKKSPAYNMGGA